MVPSSLSCFFHLHFANPHVGTKNPNSTPTTTIAKNSLGKMFSSRNMPVLWAWNISPEIIKPIPFRKEIYLFSQAPLTSLTAPRQAGQLCTWETKNQALRSHDCLRSPTDFYLKVDICHCCNYFKFILWEHCLQNLKCPLESIFLHPYSSVNYCHLECHYNTAHLEAEHYKVRASVLNYSP